MAATSRFNSKMQLFLDRLNLEPNTKAKNKLLKVKRIQKKANKKAEKLQCIHILVLSNTEYPDQLNMKRKGNCKSA